MTFITRSLGTTLGVLALTTLVLAQVPALDVRMGLWEITAVTDMSGQMPGMDTSKMTPAQQAQMAEAMRGMMGTHTTTSKTCMTKDKFDKSDFMIQDEPGMKCQQKLTTNTKTTLDGTVTCTGDRTMNGTMHLVATSPTSYTANMKMSTTEQGQTMNITMNMTGKWLGADCGTTK